MKVLHINSNYTLTTLHQSMIESLQENGGIDSRVFMATYDKSLGVISPNENVCVCECFSRWNRLFFDYKQMKIRRAAERSFQVADFDLIHAYTLFTDGNCARKLARKHGIPYVVAVRNMDVNSFLRLMPHLRGRGVQIMRDAYAVFFLSEAYRKQVFEQYVPKRYWDEIGRKTYIIPNGIDEFWFTNTPKQQKAIENSVVKLVYAGRIDKNKNIPTTQKAMELLRQRGYETTLTVVGKIKDRKEFEIIQSNPYTTCLPAMPKEQLIDVYRNADIFVMPSFTESFGLVYAEAMSQGLPVVYSKGQGFDGQFPEGQVGFSVNSASAESVAEGIIGVIEHYAQIAPNCISSAARFHWRDICQKYLEIYGRIEHS